MIGLSKLQWAYLAGGGAVVSALVGYHEPILAYANSDAPPFASVERVESISKAMVQSVRDATSEVRADIIEERLFTYRRNQCDALLERNLILADTIGEQMRKMRLDYMQITGLPYDLRPCGQY